MPYEMILTETQGRVGIITYNRPDKLNAMHPVMRSEMHQQLDAWKEAHARLYEYYKNLPEKELPDTLEEMEPLFAAVMHGCLAGKHQEALYDVYWKRIKRGNEHYLSYKLGALGTFLSCLSSFFEKIWVKPASDLTEADKAATLNWAGFGLRAVGRLLDAVQPMNVGLEMRIKQKNWVESAINASNLSELYLTLGDVASAQAYGANSVTFADRSGNGFWEMGSRTTYADALHQAEKNNAAEKLFIEAENMQKKRQSENPYLFSFQGFRFCDLLLSMGKYQEALERAQYAIKIKTTNPLSDFGLNSLTIGKALMFRTIYNRSSDFTEAKDYLNQAVDGLREADHQHCLIWGLLARAILFRHKKDFFKSWVDLDEAHEIAEYGQMKLHLTDYLLEACRNIYEQLSINKNQLSNYQIIENGETLKLTKEEMHERYQQHLQEVERLIEETGYHRRDSELEELKKHNSKTS